MDGNAAVLGSGQASLTRIPDRSVAWLPAMLTAALTTLLLIELGLRLRFPWDLFIWAESPFLTNQLKLFNGAPLFGPPRELNSFVYSPGLDYLTYGVLAPFGLSLDIRWCRLVNVLLGFGVAGVAATVIRRRVETIGDRHDAAWIFWAAFGLAALFVHKNLTSDVPHPDNLHMLHAAVTLLLCDIAVAKQHFGSALRAVLFAGLGVWTKQVEALAVVGCAAALTAGHWGWRRSLALLFTGLATSALAFFLLLRPVYARFYLFGLLVSQGFHFDLVRLAGDLTTGRRAVLLLLILPAVWHHWHVRDGTGRRFLWVWLCLGVTTALPAWSAYFKAMGTWNNLTPSDVWTLMLVAPPLFARASAHDADPALYLGALRPWLLSVLLLSVFPIKLPPTSAEYAYGRRLEERIGADLRAGKRVLLTHTAAPLIRNGVTAIPLDRANSALELWMGGRDDLLSDMITRCRQHHYARIYDTFHYHGGASEVIKQQYRVVEELPAVERFPVPPWLDAVMGQMPLYLMGPITIYEKPD